MNRKSIFIMLVIAFALIWQANYRTIEIPENYVEGSDNFHDFFDSLKDTMDQAEYTPIEFLQAARAVLEGFKQGDYFTRFTRHTDQGFQQAYQYVFANPTSYGFNNDEFINIDSGTFSKFLTFIQTCFASFSTMNPIQQINAFIQISGLYICLQKLWVTTTGICTRIYNLTTLTIRTFMNLYDALTGTTNPDSIPITIVIPPIVDQNTLSSIPVPSPKTIGAVKLKMDDIISILEAQGKNINTTTIAEGFTIFYESMSSEKYDALVNSNPSFKNPFNKFVRISSNPVYSSEFDNRFNDISDRRTRSLPGEEQYYSRKDQTKTDGRDRYGRDKEQIKTDEKEREDRGGGKRKRTKRRNQSTKRKTKRRKTTYKRRRSASRKR